MFKKSNTAASSQTIVEKAEAELDAILAHADSAEKYWQLKNFCEEIDCKKQQIQNNIKASAKKTGNKTLSVHIGIATGIMAAGVFAFPPLIGLAPGYVLFVADKQKTKSFTKTESKLQKENAAYLADLETLRNKSIHIQQAIFKAEFTDFNPLTQSISDDWKKAVKAPETAVNKQPPAPPAGFQP